MNIPYTIAAVALALLVGGPAHAQYAPTDPTHDHTWTPNNGGFSLGTAEAPNRGHGAPAGNSTTWIDGTPTVTPEPPKVATASWKYWVYFTQTKHTHGFVVNWVTTDCFDANNSQVDWSQCMGTTPPSPGQCSFNGYGFGECDPNAAWATTYRQTTYSTSKAGWFD